MLCSFLTDIYTTHACSNHAGRGKSGAVCYRAVFPDGSPATVKVLKNIGKRREREFVEAAAALAKHRHPNIVSLQGICVEKGSMWEVGSHSWGAANCSYCPPLHSDELRCPWDYACVPS